MNYKKIYNDFIQSRIELNKTRIIEHKNTHHIIPVSCGGSSDNSNLIDLTFKEHMFAHLVLYKSYLQDNDNRMALSMLYALCKLAYLPRSNAKLKHVLNVGLKVHEARYNKFISNLSNLMKGKNNPNYGHKWTDEQKKKLSLKRKKWLKEHNNWNPMDNPEYRKKISIANSGLRNGNGRHYKIIFDDGREFDIYPPVKKNTMAIAGIDYQAFIQRIDSKTRKAPKYGAKLIELPKN